MCSGISAIVKVWFPVLCKWVKLPINPPRVPNIELLQKEFYKFVNVEKADYIVDSYNESLANKVGIVEKSKNEIYGCSNIGTVLLTSDINLENCTKRQSEFERQYLYQYIYYG